MGNEFHYDIFMLLGNSGRGFSLRVPRSVTNKELDAIEKLIAFQFSNFREWNDKYCLGYDPTYEG